MLFLLYAGTDPREQMLCDSSGLSHMMSSPELKNTKLCCSTLDETKVTGFNFRPEVQNPELLSEIIVYNDKSLVQFTFKVNKSCILMKDLAEFWILLSDFKAWTSAVPFCSLTAADRDAADRKTNLQDSRRVFIR